MIKRESYMKKIRPFINSDLVKVLTGIRRCGKSVMLDLIKQELLQQGVTPQQLISYNFENMSFARLCNAQALHDRNNKPNPSFNKEKFIFSLMKSKR